MAHTRVPKGTPVLVHLKDGGKLRGKFDSYKSRHIAIRREKDDKIVKIQTRDLRELSFWKPRNI